MLMLDVLGPVRLRRNGVVLSLPVKKSLALLALLALGGSLPRQRVVALLWPQLDETSGRRNLRRELARLREAGAGESVHVEGDLLALSTEVRVDLRTFEQALLAGRSDEALALWRGAPADGLTLGDSPAFNAWYERECERLTNARRSALLASAAAREAGGDAAAALLHVEALLDDDPLQEQVHGTAMRLLAALGRREAALAQFERCKQLLMDELGLAPMAETEALAAALRGAPVSVPVPKPVRLPLLPEQLPFVGRETEVAALEDAWRVGRTLLIEGEAGVGKSRLAVDFCAAHGPYARVRSLAGDKSVPYATFTRGLRVLAGPAPDLTNLPPWAQAELTRLLPELPGGAPPPPIQSAAEHNRFLEACTQGWLALAADSFDAVIFDDWQHADAASRSLLAFIAQRRRELADPAGVRGGARELLVLRPDLDAEASAALRQLVQGSDALHLRLAALPDEAVLELVRRLSGVQQPRRFAARLHQATAGNPFFLAETLRHLAERELLTIDADGVWHTPFDEATQDYRELPVPGSVHEAVLLRVRRLPAPVQRLLEAAAQADEPFAPAMLAPACALSEMDAVLGIEAAVGAQLLREHESGGFAFAHDLVQQAIGGALSSDRRRLVHRRLALGAEAAGAPAAVIARHHEASGDAQRAVTYRLAAGDAARGLYAWAEAAEHWRQGLADGPTPSQALALHLRSMHVLGLSGQLQARRGHAAGVQALVAGAALSNEQRADGLIAVATLHARNEHAAAGLELLEQLPHVLTERQQASVMVVRAVALRRLGRIDESLAAGRAGLAMPGLQQEDRAQLLDALALIEGSAGRPHEAIKFSEARLALSLQLGDQFGIVRGKYLRGTDLLVMGDLNAAQAELQDAAELCARYGFVNVHRAVLYSLCAVYSMQSQHVQVLSTARQGWHLQPALAVSEMRLRYRVAFIESHAALGELGAAWDHAAAALEEATLVREPMSLVYWATSSLELCALLGEQQRAGPLLELIDDVAMDRMLQFSVETGIVRARACLMSDALPAAQHALAQLPPPAEIMDPRVHAMHGLLVAAVALAQGDASPALAALPAPDAPGLNDELRMRGLALRIQAQAQAASLHPDTVAAACAELGAETPHAVAALYLHQALAAAQRAGVAGAPAAAQRDCAAHVVRLAHSLRDHPAQRAAFLRRWG